MPSVISGIRAQDNFSTNREKLDFAEGIALLDPNENPFTLMSMKFGKSVSGNVKHAWLDDELQPETDTVNGTIVTAATALVVSNGGRFALGDILRVNDNNEVLLVKVVSGNTLTVTRDYGQGGTPGYTARADTILTGGYVTIIGNAFEQGNQLPVIKSTQEVERNNYCQDQRTPFGMSEIAAAAAVHGEMDWPYQGRKSGIEHMRKVEFQNIWGVPVQGGKAIADNVNDNPAAGGGIHYYIDTYTSAIRKVSQAALTQAEFITFIEAGFEYGSSAKVMFCSPILRSALDTWGISKLQTFSEKTVFGMKVATWVSAHGTISFVTHKMLKDPGADGAYNFLLDMKNIKHVTYSNIGSTRLRNLKPYESDGSTSKKAEYQTISCLEVRLPETHAMLYGVTSYS